MFSALGQQSEVKPQGSLLSSQHIFFVMLELLSTAAKFAFPVLGKQTAHEQWSSHQQEMTAGEKHLSHKVTAVGSSKSYIYWSNSFCNRCISKVEHGKRLVREGHDHCAVVKNVFLTIPLKIIVLQRAAETSIFILMSMYVVLPASFADNLSVSIHFCAQVQ